MNEWCIFLGCFNLLLPEAMCEDSGFKLKAPPSECE